jgi:TonB family protein
MTLGVERGEGYCRNLLLESAVAYLHEMRFGPGRSVALLSIFGCLVVAPCLCSAQEASGNRPVIARVTPQYPNLARGMKLQGSVKVEAVVAADGSAKTVAIKGGHPLLAQAAHDAVQKWKWVPAPRETRELIEVKFNP